MSQELDLLKIVCERLSVAGIDYMITGSTAGNFYAVPRMTRDIDLVVEVRKEDTDKLVKLFKNDFYIERESILEAIRQQGMFNIIHNDYVIKLDFIIRKNTSYRILEFQRRKKMNIEGTNIWVVSPEDLILSKLCWAKDSFSEIQLRDVKNLLSVDKNMDTLYLEQWIHLLGLEKIYERAKQ